MVSVNFLRESDLYQFTTALIPVPSKLPGLCRLATFSTVPNFNVVFNVTS